MQILSAKQIESSIDVGSMLPAIEDAFVAYSRGLGCVPPVGEMLLDKGEVHIKYGYIKGGEHYVVKIASGFYQNPHLGLPSSNGLMLLFSQQTGELVCMLHDEGRLTDHRTAMAGGVCAKYLAPNKVSAIGVIGTGIQARLQALGISQVLGCRNINIWGRDAEKSQALAAILCAQGLEASVCPDIDSLSKNSNLIVTTTPATKPILHQVSAGTLIIAVGSDTEKKQELATDLVANANRWVVDSRAQCQSRGEISHLLRSSQMFDGRLTELGEVIQHGPSPTLDHEIVIADLTGIALQDLKIAEGVYYQQQAR